MAGEKVNSQGSEVTKNRKLRVVIYGNFWNDKADKVREWANDWFNEHGLENRYEAHICKIRDAIEDAFYGKVEDNDPETIPDLVMAGKYIRDDMGPGWSDFELDGGDIERIQRLCEQHCVPLVRYRFDPPTNSPQLTSGVMMLRGKTS